MDCEHDTEPPTPQPQPDPPQTATPGRQPTGAGPQTAQPGEAAPRTGTSPQRFVTAMATLLGALSAFRERIQESYEPYADGFEAYERVLVRRAQRQEMMTQLAMQILFVGVGGAFGGMLQQFVRNRLPGPMTAAAARRAEPAPAPPAGSISRREVLGGTAPPARAAPTGPAAPSAEPRTFNQNSMPVVAAGTAAGDILKDFIKSFNPRGGGGGGLGDGEPFRPDRMLNRLNNSVQAVETRAHGVIAALSAAAERNEQIEEDPLAAIQEIIQQLHMPPQVRTATYYTREFWTRNEWFRTWRESVIAARSLEEIDRLWLHDRLFLQDIEASCPGLVRPVLDEGRTRYRQRREAANALPLRRNGNH